MRPDKEAKRYYVEEIGEDRCADHYAYARHLPGVGETLLKVRDSGIPFPKSQIDHVAYFKYGYLLFITFEPAPDAHDIFKRFAKVFEQTYTRFLDLKKAEAQAREAQIEAALERVRSKTMAMHNSQEVGNTVAGLFDELVALGLEKSARCGIGILDESNIMELWTASTNDKGEMILAIGHLDMTLHPLLKGVKKTWSSKKQSFTYELQGEDLLNYFNILNDYPDYHIYIDVKTLPEKIIHNSFYFTDGLIYCFTRNPISEDLANVVKRFSGVFGQTYKRYLDLRKAEAQAREAKIEAAMERVRARAMAMHTSQELSEVTHELRKQMGLLGQKDLDTCVIHLHDESPDFIHAWAALKPPDSTDTILDSTARVPKRGPLIIEEAMRAYSLNMQDYVVVNEGEKIKQWFGFIQKSVTRSIHQTYNSTKGARIEDAKSFWSFADFAWSSFIWLQSINPMKLPEAYFAGLLTYLDWLTEDLPT